MIYPCSGPRFGTIKNPYTGETMRVKMCTLPNGAVKYFVPDTYSPTEVFPTAEEAYRHWNRVNGVEGLKSGKPLVCAYTGKALTVVKTDDGYHYEGGFNTHLMYDRPVFLYYVTMRNGKSEYPKPEPDVRVEKPQVRGEITAGMRKHADEMKTELTDDGIATAESALKQVDSGVMKLDRSSSVSMHSSKKKAK